MVAGVRTPQPVAKLKRVLPKPFKELVLVQKKLEKHFKDMQDFEFTIEDEKLYMLQTRNGKGLDWQLCVLPLKWLKRN